MRHSRLSRPSLASPTVSVLLMLLLCSCQRFSPIEPVATSQSKTPADVETTSPHAQSTVDETISVPEMTETTPGDGSSTPPGEMPEGTETPDRGDQLKITILYDNNDYDPSLETAWGFACLVEGLEKNILFDTGGNADLLLRNMQILAIDPKTVDAIVISHIHNDHVGGLIGFLEENNNVTVYVPRSFPESLKTSLREVGTELVEVHEQMEIFEQASSTGELGTSIKEQSLIIETDLGLVVITGCAHPGIVDIVRRAMELTDQQVYLVLGGFHLRDASETRIMNIVEEFKVLGVQKVAPCHCTGDRALQVFGESYGGDFIKNGVGMVLRIPQ